MVRLRLKRKGRKRYPVYDIIAIDQRKRRDGAYLEKLGWFDPNTKPNTVVLDSDRAIYWLGVGAQPSDTVKNLFSYEGILLKRALTFKGKSEEEIAEAVKAHKEVAAARYIRRKELRVKRIQAKKDAVAEAAKKEAEAKEAENAE